MMPVVNGYQVCAGPREREQILFLPRMPVIALTRAPSWATASAAAKRGMNDCLTKPFNAAVLEAMLARRCPA